MVHFRSLAGAPEFISDAEWIESSSRNFNIMKRHGIDGVVLPYSWTNKDRPENSGVDRAVQSSIPFVLSAGPSPLTQNHLRWILTALNNPAYLRFENKPIIFISSLSDLAATRTYISTLRQAGRASGLGELFLCSTSLVADLNTYDLDACAVDSMADLSVEQRRLIKLSLDDHEVSAYETAATEALVASVNHAGRHQDSQTLLLVVVHNSDDALLKAHNRAILGASARIPALPDVTGQNSLPATAQVPLTNRGGAPTLSVVALTSGGPEALLSTLQSVLDNTPGLGGLDFLVIDNGSDDATAALLVELDGHASFIRNDTALTPGEAWAQGFAAVNGQYVLLITNDVVVDSGWFGPLVEELMADSQLNSASPAIVSNEQAGPTQPPASGRSVCVLVRRLQNPEQADSETKYVPGSRARFVGADTLTSAL